MTVINPLVLHHNPLLRELHVQRSSSPYMFVYFWERYYPCYIHFTFTNTCHKMSQWLFLWSKCIYQDWVKIRMHVSKTGWRFTSEQGLL